MNDEKECVIVKNVEGHDWYSAGSGNWSMNIDRAKWYRRVDASRLCKKWGAKYLFPQDVDEKKAEQEVSA